MNKARSQRAVREVKKPGVRDKVFGLYREALMKGGHGDHSPQPRLILGLLTVRWPNGKKRKHVVIAAIDDPQLVNEVSAFVHTVKAYKETLRGQ